MRNLRAYLAEEREATGGLVPTDRQIVVERFRDELGDWRICILSPFGARVHAPWALAIEHKVHERLDVEVHAIWSDDGIIVRLPEADEAPPSEVVILDPEEIEDLVVGEVAGSALFAARFRENAGRALLLPRRRPGSRTPLWQMRQRAADLLAVASRYASFPILLETYRECLRDVFDVPALTSVMADIRARRVRGASVDTQLPSPFASSLAFAYVANFMYEGDAPLAERRAQALTLDREMLAELLGSDELRDLLDGGALVQLEAEMQALDDRWQAKTLGAAHDLLRRLGDLSDAELAARVGPGVEPAELLADAPGRPGPDRRRGPDDRQRGRRPVSRRAWAWRRRPASPRPSWPRSTMPCSSWCAGGAGPTGRSWPGSRRPASAWGSERSRRCCSAWSRTGAGSTRGVPTRRARARVVRRRRAAPDPAPAFAGRAAPPGRADLGRGPGPLPSCLAGRRRHRRSDPDRRAARPAVRGRRPAPGRAHPGQRPRTRRAGLPGPRLRAPAAR